MDTKIDTSKIIVQNGVAYQPIDLQPILDGLNAQKAQYQSEIDYMQNNVTNAINSLPGEVAKRQALIADIDNQISSLTSNIIKVATPISDTTVEEIKP